ncbi:MAG: Stk1 family PASTA domain-containing Ser/Thr kinase [Spirochaetaceae bacterium]|nr:Stk1 family PASTA domain-containing Ser/Thr kinase [Spirochaetaceae bacterium]
MDTTVSDPLVGRLLDGRYRVGVRLARGGMATVYEAHDSRLDRTIALKVMHPSLADDEEFVSRFIREAHAAARLSHPNVVAVYDQGADQGHVFLAMELVRGRTLRDLIRERGHLSPRQALEVIEPVLAALGAAHQAGIVHRDVKPENVLLSDDNRIKVADFGLARAVSGNTGHTTASGILMGTVAYLSPEQVERGVATPRSDVYAAGILFYEMLTGVKPYDGDTAIQVAYRHVHDDVPPPSRVIPGLPAELDALVTRATNRDPEKRPADALRMLTEVAGARRQLSDTELDSLGPSLTALGAAPEHTLVVQLDAVPTPARTGDTGPLASPSMPSTGPRRRRSRGPMALLIVIALAVALSGFAWFYAAVLSQTTTPGLIGKTLAAAAAKADRAGLSVKVADSDYDEVIPEGQVLRTDPGPGRSIDKGGTVGLIMSLGPERYAVPEVVGKTEEVARDLLAESNLQVATPDRRYSTKVEEGSVISADPAVGTEVKPDTAVLLVISRGAELVAVPNVVGKPVAEAKAMLADAKLNSEVTQKFDEAVPAGVVVSQDPASGTADKRSAVTLVVSKGPPLVEVPGVVGKSVAEAQAILTSAGFLSSVSQLPGGPGMVLNQSPGGGDKAPRGSTITLYVF